VADFLGVSNLMGAQVIRTGDGSCDLRTGDFELTASRGATGERGAVRVVVRPERVALEPYGTTGPNRVPGMVERLVFVGPTTQLLVRLAPGETIQATVLNDAGEIPFEQGVAVTVHLPPDALRVLRPTESLDLETMDGADSGSSVGSA
jgi:spermidine/putrescine transport system ATP-binding protein